MDVDLEEIIAILEMLERSEVTDLRLDRGDLHFAIRRAGGEPEGLEAAWQVAATEAAAPFGDG